MARFSELSKGQWMKDSDNVVWFRDKRELLGGYDSIMVDDLLKKIDEYGFQPGSIELEMDYDYPGYDADREARLYISGWRVATPNELKAALDALDAEKAQVAARQKEYEDRQIAALKATRPELFK